jgi:hypothetical protein
MLARTSHFHFPHGEKSGFSPPPWKNKIASSFVGFIDISESEGRKKAATLWFQIAGLAPQKQAVVLKDYCSLYALVMFGQQKAVEGFLANKRQDPLFHDACSNYDKIVTAKIQPKLAQHPRRIDEACRIG